MSGIKNWHWRSKDLRPWAKDYLSQQLTQLSSQNVRLTSLDDSEGDCDLGMRKSKLVTIYDLRLSMTWETEDGAVKGSLVAVEVSHDMDEDDYVFETSVREGSGADAEKAKEIARKGLADECRKVFQKFPKVMIETFGHELLVGDDAQANAKSEPASGTATPATNGSQSSKPPAATSSSADKVVNSATVRAEATFQAAADMLFDLLTNPARVPMWSRNAATISAQPGAEVSLFGGNITGKVVKVEAPKLFVQTWRAPTWPAGHYGQLTMELNQGSSETVLKLKLDGVPIGKEDETENGLQNYYLQSLKSIGQVPSLVDLVRSRSSLVPKQHPWRLPMHQPTLSENLGILASNLVPIVISLGLMGAFIYAILNGPTMNKPDL